ncbi:MAG: helix-turn-helix transcriptional regulator [Mucilaginibacter sp.]
MDLTFEKYKGIHPGLILERELKRRQLKKGPFAISLQEYPQILNEITKGRRGLTPALSIKIDKALQLKEGTMLVLQAYYEVKKETDKANKKERPDLSVLREILFWDTDINKIDWQKQWRAVIQRVFERGNDREKGELLRFYGVDKVQTVIGNSHIDGSGIPVMSHLNQK